MNMETHGPLFYGGAGLGLSTILTCPIWGSILARHFGLM